MIAKGKVYHPLIGTKDPAFVRGIHYCEHPVPSAGPFDFGYVCTLPLGHSHLCSTHVAHTGDGIVLAVLEEWGPEMRVQEGL